MGQPTHRYLAVLKATHLDRPRRLNQSQANKSPGKAFPDGQQNVKCLTMEPILFSGELSFAMFVFWIIAHAMHKSSVEYYLDYY